MDDLIQRLRVEPTASQFLRTGDLVESLVAERKEAADRIAALEAEKAEQKRQEPVAWAWNDPAGWMQGDDEMNWQPIETAPKDGTNVLLYREAGNMFTVGCFDHAHGWVNGECIAPVAGPDYWCKLEPPK